MLPRNVHLVIVYSTLTYSLVFTQPCRRAGKDCIQRTGPPPSKSLNAGKGQLDPNAPPVEEGKPRKRCCPYEFDSSRCKVVDDRVLCGFDKNSNGAWPQSRDIIRELSDGCRLRNGRLECGYHEEPYTNFRRPPAWDLEPNNEISENEEGVVVDAEVANKLKKTSNKNNNKKPSCVEVDGSIVCMPAGK
ncbi:hypothetical protein NE865_05048 [Phthorimaea operculella]|nr:hypothetical protein NE865_05048 [Phthorimaea operculella]